MDLPQISLYLVPTPVGNLDDITIRSVNTLNEADIILAEDTRKTGLLLKHLEVATPMWSYHAHNEHQSAPGLIEEMKKGRVLAMVTDAGTPGLSDPGFLLVRACHEANLIVSCLPGATALIPAIVASGLPSDRFTFEGFLPHKKGRVTRLTALSDESRTMSFYESPHRLVKTLTQFSEFFGEDRKAAVSREISKIHEETLTGTVGELLTHFEVTKPRGEFVLIVAGKPSGK